jgi:microcystin-dependent protein
LSKPKGFDFREICHNLNFILKSILFTIKTSYMEGVIGEIRMFGGNFAPRGWALCQGQLLPISSNQALFSVLGTTYGGDGRTTFGLPDLRGRVPLGPGQGEGLNDKRLGQEGGIEANTLTEQQLPEHSHSARASVRPRANSGDPEEADPIRNYPASLNLDSGTGYAKQANTKMGRSRVKINIASTGENSPVNNMQPWLAVNFIICLQGIFPSRS